MRHPRALSNGELEAEIRKLMPHASPLSLALELDHTFKPRPHIAQISESFVDIATGKHDRLMIICPPQVGKSSTAAVWGSLWWLMANPTHRIVVASYGAALALRSGRAVKRLVEEHGKNLGIGLQFGSTANNDWSLVSGGGMRSVGVGGGLTGHSANLLILDDPHKDRAEAESLLIRDNVHEWWSSVALSRLSPGAPVVVILTRWHHDDIAGRLIQHEGDVREGGRWKVVHMPAICDKPEIDALGRRLGEPLSHPNILSSDKGRLLHFWEDKKRTSTVRDWHSIYQGEPRPIEGSLLSPVLLRERRHYNPVATPIKHAVAVDPSGGGRDEAGIIAGYLADDKKLYITHDATIRASSDAWSRSACRLAAETDADRIIVENNYGGDMARMIIRTAWDTLQREKPNDPTYQRPAPRIEMVHAKKGKLLRAEPIAQQWIEDKIRMTQYLPDLEHEWATWQPTDTHSPGRIDASVYLAWALLPVPGAAAVISTPGRLSRSAITGNRRVLTRSNINSRIG